MSNNKYNKFLTVLLVIAGIAVLGLIVYFGYDILYKKYFSSKKAEDAVDAFQEQYIINLSYNEIITENNGENTYNNNENGETNINSNQTTNVGNNSNKVTTNKSNNSTSKYEGYTMVGTIEISKISLKSPILQEISPDALKKATCLIYGNLNQNENAVIIGHNNRNGTFFSNLKKLTNGDKITITDYTGKKIVYEVYSMFQASPDDTSFYQRDTNGLSEITLSTCTDNDDSKRIIVLARET